MVKELGEDKCYFPSSVDVTVEVNSYLLLFCIHVHLTLVEFFLLKKDQVNIAVQKTLEYFSTSTLGGAILSSGIVFSSSEGYGPNNTLTSYSQFEHIIRVNLLGTYCVAQKVAQELLKNDTVNDDGERGVIITVSSILGLDGTLVGYGTSKAGIAGLTLPLAKELAPQGIRVMSIAPGPFGKFFFSCMKGR